MEGNRYPLAPEPTCVQPAAGEIVPFLILFSESADNVTDVDERRAYPRAGNARRGKLRF